MNGQKGDEGPRGLVGATGPPGLQVKKSIRIFMVCSQCSSYSDSNDPYLCVNRECLDPKERRERAVTLDRW